MALIPRKEGEMVSDGTQIEGLVVAANERGFQLQGAEKWCNWSKYAEEPRTLPAPGHAIRATLDGQGFVRTVTLVPANKRLAVEKAAPETMQPIPPRDTSNGGTAPRSGVFVASQPAMQADREFRLKCFGFAVEHIEELNTYFAATGDILAIADSIAAWAEGREV